MKQPRVLIIRLLEACNAGCFMCDFARSSDPYRFGVEDTLKLLNSLSGSNIRLIRFTGGEPLMLDDLIPSLAAIRKTGRLTSIITNGWWLPEKVEELAEVELDQVIGSLDGASSQTHDNFRNLPGLFNRLIDGLSRMRTKRPNTHLRINTVVGPHNIWNLPDIMRLLMKLQIKQWSLIPLKRSDCSWSSLSLSKQILALEEFQKALDEAGEEAPRLLGPGRELFGSSPEEQQSLWLEKRNMTPKERCHLVDMVRYYTPKDGLVYPCNCIPHRSNQKELFEVATSESFSDRGLIDIRNWLRVHGPSTCTGCEPANVALGEELVNLEADPFGY